LIHRGIIEVWDAVTGEGIRDAKVYFPQIGLDLKTDQFGRVEIYASNLALLPDGEDLHIISYPDGYSFAFDVVSVDSFFHGRLPVSPVDLFESPLVTDPSEDFVYEFSGEVDGLVEKSPFWFRVSVAKDTFSVPYKFRVVPLDDWAKCQVGGPVTATLQCHLSAVTPGPNGDIPIDTTNLSKPITIEFKTWFAHRVDYEEADPGIVVRRFNANGFSFDEQIVPVSVNPDSDLVSVELSSMSFFDIEPGDLLWFRGWMSYRPPQQVTPPPPYKPKDPKPSGDDGDIEVKDGNLLCEDNGSLPIYCGQLNGSMEVVHEVGSTKKLIAGLLAQMESEAGASTKGLADLIAKVNAKIRNKLQLNAKGELEFTNTKRQTIKMEQIPGVSWCHRCSSGTATIYELKKKKLICFLGIGYPIEDHFGFTIKKNVSDDPSCPNCEEIQGSTIAGECPTEKDVKLSCK